MVDSDDTDAFSVGDVVLAKYGGIAFYWAKVTKVHTNGDVQICDVDWLRPALGNPGGPAYVLHDGFDETVCRRGLRAASDIRRPTAQDLLNSPPHGAVASQRKPREADNCNHGDTTHIDMDKLAIPLAVFNAPALAVPVDLEGDSETEEVPRGSRQDQESSALEHSVAVGAETAMNDEVVPHISGTWQTSFGEVQITGLTGSYLGVPGAIFGMKWISTLEVQGHFYNSHHDKQGQFQWTFHSSTFDHFEGRWNWYDGSTGHPEVWSGDRIISEETQDDRARDDSSELRLDQCTRCVSNDAPMSELSEKASLCQSLLHQGASFSASPIVVEVASACAAGGVFSAPSPSLVDTEQFAHCPDVIGGPMVEVRSTNSVELDISPQAANQSEMQQLDLASIGSRISCVSEQSELSQVAESVESDWRRVDSEIERLRAELDAAIAAEIASGEAPKDVSQTLPPAPTCAPALTAASLRDHQRGAVMGSRMRSLSADSALSREMSFPESVSVAGSRMIHRFNSELSVAESRRIGRFDSECVSVAGTCRIGRSHGDDPWDDAKSRSLSADSMMSFPESVSVAGSRYLGRFTSDLSVPEGSYRVGRFDSDDPWDDFVGSPCQSTSLSKLSLVSQRKTVGGQIVDLPHGAAPPCSFGTPEAADNVYDTLHSLRADMLKRTTPVQTERAEQESIDAAAGRRNTPDDEFEKELALDIPTETFGAGCRLPFAEDAKAIQATGNLRSAASPATDCPREKTICKEEPDSMECLEAVQLGDRVASLIDNPACGLRKGSEGMVVEADAYMFRIQFDVGPLRLFRNQFRLIQAEASRHSEKVREKPTDPPGSNAVSTSIDTQPATVPASSAAVPSSNSTRAQKKVGRHDRPGRKRREQNVAEQAYNWWQSTIASPFQKFSQDVGDGFNRMISSIQEGENEDESEEEEEEDEEEEDEHTQKTDQAQRESGQKTATRSSEEKNDAPDVNSSKAPLPQFNIDFNLTGSSLSASSSAPPPFTQEKYTWLHSSVALPALRLSKDFGKAYKAFKEANEVHTFLHKRQCPECLFYMTCCLALGATRILETNGSDLVAALPPMGVFQAALLVEARLDLALSTLSQALDAGYQNYSAMMIEPDIKLLRDRRQTQMAGFGQRAQANVVMLLGMSQGGSVPASAPNLQSTGIPQQMLVRPDSWPQQAVTTNALSSSTLGSQLQPVAVNGALPLRHTPLNHGNIPSTQPSLLVTRVLSNHSSMSVDSLDSASRILAPPAGVRRISRNAG